MYQKISVPVDLRHKDQLEKAVRTAADLARHYEAEMTLYAVTGNEASSVASGPEDFANKLAQYADQQAQACGVAIHSKALVSHDLSIDLDKLLDKAFHESGTDLVVMASHVPGFRDYVFGSNAGYLATHSNLSVMIVR
ncbi:MAG: universal stress protein [Thiolinea sp.]